MAVVSSATFQLPIMPAPKDSSKSSAEPVLGELWGGVPTEDLRKLATEALKGMGGQASDTMIKSPSTVILENYNEQPLHVRSRAEQWELARSEIKLGDKLGEGDGGVILHAEWRGLDVVAKMLKSGSDGRSQITCAVQRADLINEVSVLSRLRHPNLVMFLGACTIGEPLLILSEHMRGGNLEEFIIQSRKSSSKPWVPPLKLVFRWSVEIARAICFMHNCSPAIIHRDLKPANLLLNEDGHVKVGDFGLCKVKQGAKISGTYVMTGKTGSMRYMAPEVFHDNPNYDEKVDIYSTAMIMWYIAMGERPFDRVPADVVAEHAAKTGLRPSLTALSARIGPEFTKAVESSWDSDAAKRPSANQLVDMLEDWGHKLPAVKERVGGKSCAIM